MKTYLRVTGERVVMAKARLIPPLGSQRSMGVVVDQCPFCGYQHRHTLSNGDYSAPHYGIRESDCFKGQYLMVDEEIFDSVGTDQ